MMGYKRRDTHVSSALIIHTEACRGDFSSDTMTIWCNSCKCHVRAPCTLPHHGHKHDRSLFSRQMRSTKGASKSRRDRINHEIRKMRALLPIPHDDQERLSYLHSMAAICTYIRKSVLLRGVLPGDGPHCSLPYEAFLQALHGFVLVTTSRGKLVYVSENVAEYLGLSMIDVLQGHTFYDMLEASDVDDVKLNLDMENNSSTERSFICCMQTSKAFKLHHSSSCSMLVRGSFQSVPLPSPSPSTAPGPLFVALCTPTVNRLSSSDSSFCHSFTSVHRLDMSFTQLSDSVLFYLGYSADEMTGRSWYSLIHPDDLSLSADSHRSIIDTDEGFQVEMVLRLQCEDLSWAWVYTRAIKDSECQGISCTNYIISETEARFLQKEIGSDAFRPSSPANSCHIAAQQAPHSQTYNNTKSFKRQRTSDSQSEEPAGVRVRRESERGYSACVYSRDGSSPVPSGDVPTALFTPPYSPASSGSPLQQEELSHDLLMDVHGYSDQLLSSPEASPSYYSYPEAALTCHPRPSDSLPAAAGHSFDQAAFGEVRPTSPLSSSSSPNDDFQSCTSDARLVPDYPSASDMCGSLVECALHQDDYSLLEQPEGGDLFQVQHVPQHQVMHAHSSLLTPNQSPTSSESNQYNEWEQAEISILAQQISSLASSFDMYHTIKPLQRTAHSPLPSAGDWPQHPPHPSVLPLKCDLVLDDGVIDSILKDLDTATRKSNTYDPAGVSYSYQQGLVCSRSGPCHLEQEPLGPSTAPPEETLPAERFTAMDPFSLQFARYDQNTGLHQLNHNMHISLQQDGLAKEHLY